MVCLNLPPYLNRGIYIRVIIHSYIIGIRKKTFQRLNPSTLERGVYGLEAVTLLLKTDTQDRFIHQVEGIDCPIRPSLSESPVAGRRCYQLHSPKADYNSPIS